MKKHSFFVAACCLLFAVCPLLFLPACSKEKDQQMKKPAVPVTAGSAIKKSVPVQIRAIGNVEPYSAVLVKARIGGELMKVYFTEGQDVNKGQLLFLIDPKPYEAALSAAEANLARDRALAKKAEDDLVRYTELLREELVSRDKYEQVFANAEALKATLKADAAAVENARLQLSYCSIYAPVSGRTGSLLVNQGNLIKANDDKPMVIINQIQPIYVNFSVPERLLAEIKKYMSAGKLNVLAYVNKEDEKPETGILTFVDNTVDISTATIKLKGTFTNKGKHLWPGQFVNVVMTLTTRHDAIVIPSHAVQTGQTGQYVFVIKGDIAELRSVTAGITHKDETVVEKGIEPGEMVVTDGHMRLVPDAKVEIKKTQEQKGSSPKESPKNESPTKDKAK